MRELRPVAGVRAVIEELHAGGHAMAVASQSPLARVRFSLDVTGLAGFFDDRIYVTSMVARPKPAPDIYLHAARQLGVEPTGCLVIEDSPAGAAAAHSAGFQVLGFAPQDAASTMRAAGIPVIGSMSEVLRHCARRAAPGS
jgi:HAD superfamily hydrolase (TIGR01509 family)